MHRGSSAPRPTASRSRSCTRPSMTALDYDAIVLGAGAAGLMCAAVAGQRGRRVLLLDPADQVGKKILISGGGRCNFPNIYTAPEDRKRCVLGKRVSVRLNLGGSRII